MSDYMQVANEIKSQLVDRGMSDRIILMSWAARDFMGTSWSVHNETVLGVLRFRVSGAKHKGLVEVALMPSDTYRVTLFKMDKRAPNGYKIMDTIEDVYFDVLTEVIDRRVEAT